MSTKITRRRFIKHSSVAASAVLMRPAAASDKAGAARPNILWITCEDLSPHLGCYGEEYARSPNIDRLAAEGVRYDQAFAAAPVCAPARSSLIAGVYACSLGSHHMRSRIALPRAVRPFPAYLRDAGYYCTNNSKTDYNFPVPEDAWDESSNRAHWRNRPADRPFFAVFNFNTTHESQIRAGDAAWAKRTEKLTGAERHDPAKAPVPPYHPDAPEVRKDWARYHDSVSLMDRQVGDLLSQLDADGLADDTVVFFFSDHGDGMPRGKRWLYDSGLRVPLIIRFPARWRHLAPGAPGTATDRLVDFTDFGPTLLRLAGVPVPAHMQGRPFLGGGAAPPRRYVYAFRDRMDERYDCARAVRDGRYKYVRNFQPHLPQGQHLSFMFETPTTRAWEERYREGGLNPVQSRFWEAPKPVEELYDTQADPHEIANLAADPAHRETLLRMRAALEQWMRDVRDLGLLPEAEMHARLGPAPYAAVREHPEKYPLDRCLDTARLLLNKGDALAPLTERLSDPDAAVRYQAATGMLYLGPDAKPAGPKLTGLLQDPSPSVRVAAAEWVGRYGEDPASAVDVLARDLRGGDEHAALHAANALDRLDARARPALAAMTAAHENGPNYVKRVLEKALKDLRG